MTTREAIAWFKRSFYGRIAAGLEGTPFSPDLVTAIAMQETGYIWSPLVAKGLSEKDVLRLCVGDTLDGDKGRKAFPRSKADLLAAARGAEMFAIAREACVEMAKVTPGYGFALKNANKFCHGFGIFQYDIQFFKTNPSWFLQRCWCDFSGCLGQLVIELKEALARQGWSERTVLSDTDQVFVAIAYNRGRAKVSLGFRQGHCNNEGRFYGENIHEFLRIAQSVPVLGQAMVATPPAPGVAPIAAPTTFSKIRPVFVVRVNETALCLRSQPKVPKKDSAANVIARLPAGQLVQRLSPRKVDGFLEVETSLNGAYYRGWAFAQYLQRIKRAKKVKKAERPSAQSDAALAELEVPVVVPEAKEPVSGVVAVYMPRRTGLITRRSEPAGAHSLNEAGQPTRQGESAGERCAELAAIIEWLAVDNPAHVRYQPRGPTTYCNIYAHDYCYLAGVYLPRVWWTPGAIERLGCGETVEPLYEKTIDEQRANDLFRWLRDFGLRFGWRQTGTLTKLQEAANLGGIGIIVARRKEDGRSGHIVVVVPEADGNRARRDQQGEVIGPLQSQAGVVNFRYRVAGKEWWKGEQFADSAFWIHA